MSVTVVFCDPANVVTQRRLLHTRFVDRVAYSERGVIEGLATAIEATHQAPEWLAQGCYFDIEFSAAQIPFMAMTMHVECGGSCIGLRHGRIFSAFDIRGAPDFDWMWQDVEFYLLHSVEVMSWETQEPEIRARIARDTANSKRPIKA